MQNYQNRSYTVQAKEMTLGEYIIEYGLCDKALRTHNRPDDKGYMVINPNVSERNVEGVDGYVSWLPEKAFHEIYSDVISERLSTSELEALIKQTEYVQPPGSHSVVCILTLKKGYVVTGTTNCVRGAENFTQDFARNAAFEKAIENLRILHGYHTKAESEPLEQTWQGRLLLEYRQLQERTEKLYQFLSANPDHEAAEILSAQYHPMREYLSVLQDRVGALDKPVMQLPPPLKPSDK